MDYILEAASFCEASEVKGIIHKNYLVKLKGSQRAASSKYVSLLRNYGENLQPCIVDASP